ncbi:MAG: hypothetical protein ABSC25_20145 [Roseiarcus sp.]|jgi:hypothetical protein
MVDDATLEATVSPSAARSGALRNRIAATCHAIRLAAVVWIAWTLGLVVYAYSDRAGFVAKLAGHYGLDPSSFAAGRYWTAFAVVLADWSVSAILVAMLWRLTRGYLAGEIFTAQAAFRLRAVAFAGFAATIADIVARPVQFALLSPDLPSKVPLYGYLNPQDLLYAIISGFLLGLAIIFRTAAEIADDNAQIV